VMSASMVADGRRRARTAPCSFCERYPGDITAQASHDDGDKPTNSGL
jgi:hypothetical protein